MAYISSGFFLLLYSRPAYSIFKQLVTQRPGMMNSVYGGIAKFGVMLHPRLTTQVTGNRGGPCDRFRRVSNIIPSYCHVTKKQIDRFRLHDVRFALRLPLS